MVLAVSGASNSDEDGTFRRYEDYFGRKSRILRSPGTEKEYPFHLVTSSFQVFSLKDIVPGHTFCGLDQFTEDLSPDVN